MYYKVVKIDGERRVSSFADGDWLVEYSQEAHVEAPEGYLFIYDFPSDRSAKQNAGEFTFGTELWECEATNVRDADYRYPLYRKFWADYWCEIKGGARRITPCLTGECWADSVRLTRRVEVKPPLGISLEDNHE